MVTKYHLYLKDNNCCPLNFYVNYEDWSSNFKWLLHEEYFWFFIIHQTCQSFLCFQHPYLVCTHAQSLNCLQSWQVMFFQKKSLVWARVLCTPTHDFKKMPKWHSAMHCQMFRASANPECLSKRGAQFGEIFLKGVFLCSGNWKFHVKFLEFLQFLSNKDFRVQFLYGNPWKFRLLGMI